VGPHCIISLIKKNLIVSATDMSNLIEIYYLLNRNSNLIKEIAENVLNFNKS